MPGWMAERAQEAAADQPEYRRQRDPVRRQRSVLVPVAQGAGAVAGQQDVSRWRSAAPAAKLSGRGHYQASEADQPPGQADQQTAADAQTLLRPFAVEAAVTRYEPEDDAQAAKREGDLDLEGRVHFGEARITHQAKRRADSAEQ